MLGTTHPTVSMAAGILKQAGIIRYSIGRIKILDIVQLEKRSCSCYRVIKNHLDNFTEFDSEDEEQPTGQPQIEARI